jgi:hypothetical protein
MSVTVSRTWDTEEAEIVMLIMVPVAVVPESAACVSG